jgi:hypothetical protein
MQGGLVGKPEEEDCLEDQSVDKGLTLKVMLKIGL